MRNLNSISQASEIKIYNVLEAFKFLFLCYSKNIKSVYYINKKGD